MDHKSHKLHICIDCGGSKTAAAISVNMWGPTVVSRGTAGPSNYKDNGLRTFLGAIRTATQMALHGALGKQVELPTIDAILTETYEADATGTHLYSAWIGASGIDAAQDITILQPLLSRLLGIPSHSGRLIVANDAHLLSSPLLTVAESVSEAVVAIAGTGSVVVSFRKQCLSINPSREHITQLARAGGWGYLLGDDGSGFFAGKEAIREVLRTFDESQLNIDDIPANQVPQSGETLTSLLLSHFKLNSPDELFSVVYAPDSAPEVFVNGDGDIGGPQWARLNRKERIVSLAPLVFRAAFELKDKAALRALRTSVGGLARQIASLCNKSTQTGSTHFNNKRVTASSSVLCLGGSLFKVEGYRNLLSEELAALGQVFQQVVCVEDASGEAALGLAKLFA